MPTSFGFHPALRWQLDEGGSRDGHALVFADREAAPIRRLRDGLLDRKRHPSPVVDACLHLDDGLFSNGAIIFDQLTSRRIDYVAPSGRSVSIEFPACRILACGRNRAPASFASSRGKAMPTLSISRASCRAKRESSFSSRDLRRGSRCVCTSKVDANLPRRQREDQRYANQVREGT